MSKELSDYEREEEEFQRELKTKKMLDGMSASIERARKLSEDLNTNESEEEVRKREDLLTEQAKKIIVKLKIC